MKNIFSGSYSPHDVQFLLKPVTMEFVDIEAKEKYIQSKQKHYSEMLSVEHLPSEDYMKLFEQAMTKNALRFAQDILALARIIIREKISRQSPTITLVSLARAGTPVGVLLKRALESLGEDATHYSVSIIRDIGIDYNALKYILCDAQKPAQSLFFIDGWTGKGVINDALEKSMKAFYESSGINITPELFVVADLCGKAAFSATSQDYLLPSSILNAIVSGLISRSVLNAQLVGEKDFHACVYYENWHKEDLSTIFVEEIFTHIRQCLHEEQLTSFAEEKESAQDIFTQRLNFLEYIQKSYDIKDINHIKPGIGEATRVLLRRMPHMVFLRQKNCVESLHIERLAQEKGVPIVIEEKLPYTALAIIQSFTTIKG